MLGRKVCLCETYFVRKTKWCFKHFLLLLNIMIFFLQKLYVSEIQFNFSLNDERDRIVLSNQGSIIQYLHPSIISIDDLNDNKFDHQYCCENFFFPQGTEEGYLMTVTVQELSGASGMVIHFGIHHKLCDVIGAFLVVADFCSQVKNGCLKYEKVRLDNFQLFIV